MHRILFVDDEIQILKSYRRAFYNTNLECFFAQSGLEALETIQMYNIDLIITDIHMPEMNGYELLNRVQKIYPNVVRMVLSGDINEDNVLQAFRQNIARAFLFKPWNNSTFIDLVNLILKKKDFLVKQNMFEFVNNTIDLIDLDSRNQNVSEYINKGYELQKIIKAIEMNQALSLKLLHIVNSDIYHCKTGSIKEAVTILGKEKLLNLISKNNIDDLELNDNGLFEKIEKLWDHSYLTNQILTCIYKKFIKAESEKIYLSSGLFHNIGTVLMLERFHDIYKDILNTAIQTKQDINSIEKKKFGFSHSELGASLLLWWDMPLPIVEAALYCQNPFDNGIDQQHIHLISAVHIAQQYASELLQQVPLCKFEKKCFKRLGLDETEFELYMRREFFSDIYKNGDFE